MKPPKRIVVLSSAEYGLAFNGMLHFRNKLIQQGRYTDAVDELLIKLQKARRCRHPTRDIQHSLAKQNTCTRGGSM